MVIFRRILVSLLLGLMFAATAHAGLETDFSERPSYLPSNVLSLTFDDGPDWNNTARVLDILKDKGVQATFFINSDNWSNINTQEPMRELVRRMVREGHTLANHSVSHTSLAELSDQDAENSITGVQDTVNSIFGDQAPRMTLFRAPFGQPFQFPDASYPRISEIVARHAVHVGWNIDSFDYECAIGDGDCVFNNLVGRIQTPNQGAYGIILLHSVHSQTANALPALIDYIRDNGFNIWPVEDVVRARYGRSSAELIGGG